MEAESLAAACELAFAVAREGEKAVPPVEPPPAMRNYLYVANLPRRAMTVAQRAMEEDPEFKRRVAEEATEQRVGSEAYRWLTGGSGAVAPSSVDSTTGEPVITEPAPIKGGAMSVPSPVPPAPLQVPVAVSTPMPSVPKPSSIPSGVTSQRRVTAPPLPDRSKIESNPLSGQEAPSSAIEDELASLRGMVDQLSEERKAMSSRGVVDPNQVANISTDQDTAQNPEAAQNQADESGMQADQAAADEAQRQLDDVTKRLGVATARIEELEAELVEAYGSASESGDELDRISSELVSSGKEIVGLKTDIEDLASDLEVANANLGEAKDQLESERSKAERLAIAVSEKSDLAVKVAVEESKAASAEVTDRVQIELEEATSRGDRITAELEEVVGQRDQAATELAELRHEFSLASGAMVERDHLKETLSVLETERDEFAARADVAEQARIDLEAELENMSVRVQTMQVELESARMSLSGTRGVFESSMKDIDDGLSRTEEILSNETALESEPSVPFDDFISLEDEDEDETEEIETSDVPFGGETLDEVSTDSLEQIVSEPSVADDIVEEGNAGIYDDAVELEEVEQSTDLESMLDTYGLGAGVSVVDGLGESAADHVSTESLESPVAEFAIADSLNADPLTTESVADLANDEAEKEEAESSEPSSDRRQIVLPDGLSRDSLDAIRHVVGTDDVMMLVDGDAVAELGWPETEVAVRRDALVKYLGDLAADTGAAQDAVFSGSFSEGDELPVSRAVRVRITSPSVTPAEALAELVTSYPAAWPVAVVSDDETLVSYANQNGATVLGNAQLLDLLFDRWESSQ